MLVRVNAYDSAEKLPKSCKVTTKLLLVHKWCISECVLLFSGNKWTNQNWRRLELVKSERNLKKNIFKSKGKLFFSEKNW